MILTITHSRHHFKNELYVTIVSVFKGFLFLFFNFRFRHHYVWLRVLLQINMKSNLYLCFHHKGKFTENVHLYDCTSTLMATISVSCSCANIKAWSSFVTGGANDTSFFRPFVAESLTFPCFLWTFRSFDTLRFFFDLECIVCFFLDFS